MQQSMRRSRTIADLSLIFRKSHRNVTAEQVRKLRTGLDASVVPVGVIVDRPVEQAAMLLNEGIGM